MRTPESPPSDRGARIVFCLAVLVALGFALYTNQRWEDYYITFRPSKNLATGHGLVFQVGQRVHTYTSPLGVLLPAFTSWVSGGQSDEVAFWLFRFISIGAFAGAVSLVWRTGRAWGWRASTCALAAGLLLTDAKSVSFSVNGMETGFLLLFIALSLLIYTRAPRHGFAWLGAAWAGLMWTRPDAFVTIGALGAGFWLFPRGQRLATTRGKLLLGYLKSGLVCTALYGPWFAWAWSYYGSPIPNTIVAKGLGHRVPPLSALLGNLVLLPVQSWTRHFGSGIFMPSYFGSGGWPAWSITLSELLILAALAAVLVPRVRAEVRTLSLATIVVLFYVSNTELYPWYLPPVTLLAILTLASLGESLHALLPERLRGARVWLLPGLAVVVFSATLLVKCSRQAKWQQTIIEGQRREIGLWLRANRQSPNDTVFLESLGYIGYYSQLKMYDYPGMSSPEVVEARRRLGENWANLIPALKPRWLVLRPQEVVGYRLEYQPWFQEHYTLATAFDARQKLADVGRLPGWNYLNFDAVFLIYRLNPDAGS